MTFIKLTTAAAVLAGLSACATPVPVAFDGTRDQIGNATPLVIPVTPPVDAVAPPPPVSTTPLDGPARAPVPLPSSNGMPPPPVEIGVVGPVPADLPPLEPLVMDEDVAG